jgi:hypothetical protein
VPGTHNLEREQSRPNEFTLQAADILLQSDTLVGNHIKQVIYAGHAWHQRERGRRTTNLATTSYDWRPRCRPALYVIDCRAVMASAGSSQPRHLVVLFISSLAFLHINAMTALTKRIAPQRPSFSLAWS